MTSGRGQSAATDFGLATAPAPATTTARPGRPELVAALRREIERDGPITFARFMQRALYEPGLGYYATSGTRPTRQGDFLTAPELHPLFGHAVAHQIDEMWQRLDESDEFVVREYGAGSGALALAVLEELARMRSRLLERVRYEPIEVADRSSAIRDRLSAAGFGRVVEAPSVGQRFVGCVLANEFLDALPVHRVVQRDGELRELYVEWRDGRFAETEGRLSTPELAAWFAERGIELADGQRAEANLALTGWIGEVAAALEAGYVLAIDYGAEPAALFAPSRASGTIRAFRGQRVSGDPYGGVGEQDVTAHVDLDALRRSAVDAGMDVLGTTTQAEFLIGCGLEQLMAAEQQSLPEEWQPRLLLRAAVGRLLDPRQMGGYAVVVLGRGVSATPPLRGLAFQLPMRS
ncbi:MAG TPA: SAM-dependent methyltransferase [Candidatus Caenarcaniphilales bacterium]|nr:SAM-dependent methyltransferase [Candidatus Caenarcaniphilales bacterium]